MTQTTGPQVAANETMKPARQTSVTIAAGSPAESGVGSSSERQSEDGEARHHADQAEQEHRLASDAVDDPDRDTVMTTFRSPITRLA